MARQIREHPKSSPIEDQSFVLRAHLEPRNAETLPCQIRIRVRHVNSGEVWMESDIDQALARIRGSLTQNFFPKSN